MKHSGKTTHGRLLAEKFNADFTDTDAEIERFYEQEYGVRKNCREIYTVHDGLFFRNLERLVMNDLAEKLHASSVLTVISPGGGLLANQDIQPILAELGMIVYLKVDYEILFKRIIAKGIPPFLENERPLEHFIEVCEEREKYYLNCADLVIHLEDGPEMMINEIIYSEIVEFIQEKKI
jgi:shikimate kinase